MDPSLNRLIVAQKIKFRDEIGPHLPNSQLFFDSSLFLEIMTDFGQNSFKKNELEKWANIGLDFKKWTEKSRVHFGPEVYVLDQNRPKKAKIGYILDKSAEIIFFKPKVAHARFLDRKIYNIKILISLILWHRKFPPRFKKCLYNLKTKKFWYQTKKRPWSEIIVRIIKKNWNQIL